MQKRHLSLFITLFIATCSFAFTNGEKSKEKSIPSSENFVDTRSPELLFEKNMGQFLTSERKMAENVLYKGEFNGLETYLTRTGLSYVYRKFIFDSLQKEENEHPLLPVREAEHNENHMKLIGEETYRVNLVLKNTNKDFTVSESDKNLFYTNYYSAQYPEGITNVPHYGQVQYENVWNNINWRIKSSANGLKHEFVLSEGADLKNVSYTIEGAKKIEITEGRLKIVTPYGTIEENELYCYVEKEGVLTEINGKYKIERNGSIGFDINWDGKGTLVIDPNVLWATYHIARSSTGSAYRQMILDKAGNLFVTGATTPASGFPVLNPFGGAYFQGTINGTNDVFIMRFSPGGVKLWATFYGGSGDDYAWSVKPDNLGNIFVVGNSNSTDFPVQNAYDPTSNGLGDAFVMSFKDTGVRNWATYLGGSANDNAYSVAADIAGNVYITGNTSSNNFPVINPGGGAYIDATSGGGASNTDIFIAKLTKAGMPLWSTYYGGSGGDAGYAITVDLFGNIYLTGMAGYYGGNFPVLDPGSGAYFQGTYGGDPGGGSVVFGDAFILKFNATLSRQWSTYYSGAGSTNEAGWGVVTDACGNLFVIGCTDSPNFPTYNPGGGAYFDNTYNNGTPDGSINGTSIYDLFILKFDINGVRKWATLFGGTEGEYNFPSDSDNSISIDSEGKIYIAFGTYTSNISIYNPGSAYSIGPVNAARESSYLIVFTNNGALAWSTYVGEDGTAFPHSEEPHCVSVDGKGNIVYMSGNNSYSTFQLKDPGGGAYVKAHSGNGMNNGYDMYFIKFSPLTTLSSAGFTATPKSACAPLTVNFANASTGYDTYTWNFGEGTPATTYNASHVYNTPGVYPVSLILKKTSTCLNDTLRDTIRVLSCNINGVSKKLTVCTAACPVITASTSGPSPYTYSWNTGSTTQTINPCPSANTTYYVKITDASGVTHTDTTYVTITPVISAIISASSATCSGSNTGSATANAGNGVSPFSYNWNNGQTTATIINLNAGIYSVTVTDANGCTGTKTVSITTYPTFSIATSSTPSKCTGGKDGTASATASGSTGTFNYSWLPPISSTYNSNSNIAQLSSGTYTVVVKDVNGCTASTTVVVPQNPPPSPAFTVSPDTVVCAGTAISFTHTGTTTGVTNYSWTNYCPAPFLSTSAPTQNYSYSFVSAGTYTITHSVNLGSGAAACSERKTVTVVVTNCVGPNPGVSTLGGGCVTSGDCSKNISAVSAGGTPPYTYSWNTGATTSSISPCATSNTTYIVTVKDALGATNTAAATLSIIPSANFTKSIGRTICIGTTVNFTGVSTGGATYSWTIGAPANVSGTTVNYSYNFLSIGTYSIYHSASSTTCGASQRDTIIVINCSGPSVTATGTSVCWGSCATITSTGTGGTSPYTYSWSNGSTTQNISPCPVTTTIYTVTIRDTGGTTATATAIVTVNPSVSVTVTPTNITCNGGTNGSAIAAGTSGTAPFTYNWSGGIPGSGFQISGLSAGNYTVTITDNKGCTASSTTTIASPPPLNGQFSKGTSGCAGCGCKEWLLVTATGGISPYSYSWPDGYVNRYKNQLCPGSYSINIKDKNGCSVNVNLTAP